MPPPATTRPHWYRWSKFPAQTLPILVCFKKIIIFLVFLYEIICRNWYIYYASYLVGFTSKIFVLLAFTWCHYHQTTGPHWSRLAHLPAQIYSNLVCFVTVSFPDFLPGIIYRHWYAFYDEVDSPTPPACHPSIAPITLITLHVRTP